MSTYVVSDLHGYYDIFRQGLKTIRFTKDDRLYVIGDAIDRGIDGIRILRELKRRENMDLILGNHEFMMLNSINPNGEPVCDGGDSDLWLNWNGGDRTFEKYRRLSVNDRKELILWLQTREITKEIFVTPEGTGRKQRIILTHSYFDEKCIGKQYCDYPPRQLRIVWDVVWKSMFRSDTWCPNVYEKHAGTVFVTGHVPVQRAAGNIHENIKRLPEVLRIGNFLNIDGGLSFGHIGVKNAAIFLRLEDMHSFVIPLSHEGFEDRTEIF